MPELDPIIATIQAARQLLAQAAFQYDDALQHETAGTRSAEVERLDERLHNITHELESEIGLALHEIALLRRRIQLQRTYHYFSPEIFDRIVTEGWSIRLVDDVYQASGNEQTRSRKELSEAIKHLHAAWHAGVSATD